jgi:hypothetical protein
VTATRAARRIFIRGAVAETPEFAFGASATGDRFIAFLRKFRLEIRVVHDLH